MKNKTKKKEPSVYSIRAVDRALEVLSCFSVDRQRLSLADLEELIRFSKSALFRILKSLEVKRFVSFDPDSDRYCLGTKALELGRVAFSSLSLNNVAGRYLDSLVSENKYPILMAILSDGELVVVDERRGNEHVQLFGTGIGMRKPPYHGSAGMLLMAYLGEKEVDHLLQRYHLVKLASRSISDPVQFKRRLQQVRGKGYCYEESELVEGLIGVSAPVRNHRGKVVAAVGGVLPSALATQAKKNKLIFLVTETGRKISEALGFSKAAQSKKRGE